MNSQIDLASILLSATPGFASGEDVPSGTLQIRMNNVTSNGSFDWSVLRRVPADDGQREKYQVEPGDILFNSTNSPELVGKAAVFAGRSETVLFSNHFLRIRTDRSVVDPRYVARWLNYQWRVGRFERIATRWVNQAAVRKEDLLALSLSLPSLREQEQIADLLDTASRLRDVRLAARTESSSLLSELYVERFSSASNDWDVVEIGQLADTRRGSIRTGPFGSQLLHSEFTDHGIAVLGIDNAVNNRFEWAERRFITAEKFEQLRRYQVYPGDVLITIMATCGRCAVVPSRIGTAINTKHLCCISLDTNRCLPTFLHGAFLHDPYVRRQLESATKGAIMDGLNMEIIKGIRMPLPPISVQQQYASLAADCDRLFATARETDRQATHLFDGLLEEKYSTV